MIPARRLLWLLLAWLLLGTLTAVLSLADIGDFTTLWLSVGAALLAALLADALLLWPNPGITATRSMAKVWSLGVNRSIRLRLSARSTWTAAVFDHYPVSCELQGLPQRVAIPAQGWVEIEYQLRPLLRGDQTFGRVELRVASGLGLWQRRCWAGEVQTVKVYPNFAAVAGYALLATDQRLSQIGVLKKRRRGEGTDFHQLREYRQGDSLRAIDWKATSRTRKLIARDYQEERDQQVVFLLDCGRRMLARDGDMSHFDHALNAMLLLSYVALRQGDAVGLLTFAGTPRWLQPVKSAANLKRVLNSAYDLQPTKQASDYLAAAENLTVLLKKRALVVIVTNLRDEDDDTLLPALSLLRKRHLVLVASLREQVLDTAITTPVHDFPSALRHAATLDYLATRRQAFQRLANFRAECLDVLPHELPIRLVNRYLDIKQGGRL